MNFVKDTKIKIARIATVPFAFLCTLNTIENLEKEGNEITVICSKDDNFNIFDKINITKVQSLKIVREISPIKDLVSIYNLFKYLRKNKFSITHSNTPKGGLVTSIAAFLARTPVRVHTFTGQRWATLSGWKKRLLITCDKIICYLNTHCYADSHSQVNFLLENGIGSKKKLSCIHLGCFGGVDIKKYNTSVISEYLKKPELTDVIEKSKNKIVITFVGRLVQDKGMNELISAFRNLQEMNLPVFLLLVGPYEPTLDPLSDQANKEISDNENIISVGMQAHPEHFLALSDIFCLPSYREGFPSVILDAAAMGVPSVGFNINGTIDAIADNQTGLLCQLKDVEDLTSKLKMLVEDDELRLKMGQDAEKRVHESFTSEKVTFELNNEYKRLVKLKTKQG